MANDNDVTINELMEFLQENMLTKEDGENFATKDDLKNFATKDDLKNFATKDDFFGLREEMQQGFSQINTRLDSIDRELEDIKERLTRLEQKVQEEGTMYAHEVVGLRKRVDILEQQVKQLQAAT